MLLVQCLDQRAGAEVHTAQVVQHGWLAIFRCCDGRVCGGWDGTPGNRKPSRLGLPHNQGASQGPEECHQFLVILSGAATITIVPISHFALVNRSGFHSKIDFSVDVRGAEAGVSQPNADGVDVHPSPQQVRGGCVTLSPSSE